MSYHGYSQRAPQGGYAPPPQQQQGYSAHHGGPPPPSGAPPGYGAGTPERLSHGHSPGTDPQLWQWFTAVDLDRSGQISASELERALINGDWTPFDLDTVKLLMSMFDMDRSGTIGFNEFAGLWKYIKDWQGVFRHFDLDRSGSIDSTELTAAIHRFGYNLSPQLLQMVQRKYDVAGSAPSSRGGPPPSITFDRFVRACVVIKQLSETFRRLDNDQDGWVQINYDTFMQTVLSLP